MTNPEDKGGKNPAGQGNAPSWVDEVLGDTSGKSGVSAGGPQDLRIPETQEAAKPAAAPSWVDEVSKPTPEPAPAPQPQAQAARPAPTRYADDDADWVSRATSSQAKDPQMPQGPAVTPAPVKSDLDTISDTARQAMQQFNSALGSGDVSQKKLIAGLLAIFLGSLGVHKFYLGMNNPGLILLGVNVGVWILAIILGLITLGIGLVVTVPLAGLVSSALAVFGLVEGIIYLTKTDADFKREYIDGKKPWL